MGYTNVALKDKIMEMYPEKTKHRISPRLGFRYGRNAKAVKLVKGIDAFNVCLDKDGMADLVCALN